MAKTRILMGLLGSGLMSLLLASPGWGAPPPTAEQVLQFRPRQEGVNCSTPAPEDTKKCEVQPVKGSRGNTCGWLLLDAKKLPLRRFFDAGGGDRINTWSYYKDGVEVYREADTNYNNRPDNYRWFNSGGMKWGVDVNEDGRIDGWKMISAEEVAREVFYAAASQDLHRFQALFISDAEIRGLKWTGTRADQIRANLKEAVRKFQTLQEKMTNLNAKAQFVRVESATPQCIPAEQLGTPEDLIQFPSRTILYQGSDQKHDWLQTGEMLKVGLCWRLVGAPGQDTENRDDNLQDKELQKLLEQLSELDNRPPTLPQVPGPSREVAQYNLLRAQLIEKIVPHVKKESDRETWIKQVLDNLSTAAQYSDAKDKQAILRLGQIKDQMVKATGGNLAAYATFQYLLAEYTPRIGTANQKESRQAQEEFLDKLADMAKTYATAEVTPEVLILLGTNCEALSRDEEAKRWYHQLASSFQGHPLAAKAAGAKRRLDLVGKDMVLSGNMLQGGTFDIARLKGKAVVVYYWASYCSTCISDFARLKQVHTTFGPKGLELVFVNLDEQRELASRYLQSNPVPGIHLYQSGSEGGSLSSPMAVQYGIQGLPTMFLVGRDGKVISRNLQITEVEEAVRRALP